MLVVELIPLNEGKRISLDPAVPLTIGRTPMIGCMDNRISRNHAQLHVKPDGTVWIKPVHQNPTFYRTKAKEIVRLTKDKEYQLCNDDQVGLLPDAYFYRVSIQLIVENLPEEVLVANVADPPAIDEPKVLPVGDQSQEKLESQTNPAAQNDHDENPTTTTALLSQDQETYPVRKRIKLADRNDHSVESNDGVVQSTEQAVASTEVTASSSAKRERCPYREFCYRKNPIHLQEAIHPGDRDWQTEEDNATTKLPCPYGDQCYRKNAEHLNEYEHRKTSSTDQAQRPTAKRKANDDDYDDSFIDDEDLEDSVCADQEDDTESDDADEWRPEQHARPRHDTDMDSSDDSDVELVKQEASEFIRGSTADRYGSVTKKPRTDAHDD